VTFSVIITDREEDPVRAAFAGMYVGGVLALPGPPGDIDKPFGNARGGTTTLPIAVGCGDDAAILCGGAAVGVMTDLMGIPVVNRLRDATRQ
jgi:hypothetical protein